MIRPTTSARRHRPASRGGRPAAAPAAGGRPGPAWQSPPAVSAARRLAFARRPALAGWLAVAGSGLVVMLADTDAGSVITAAASGARWGYSLLGLQVLLIPVLFLVQDLAVRLGITTRRGFGELIRERFGPAAAWTTGVTLVVVAVGALVTELAGISGAAGLFGISPAVAVPLTAGFLLLVVWSGSYRSVERVALLCGMLELAFVAVAIGTHPSPASMFAGLAQAPLGTHAYLFLVAANIGAVVMPWMIFYQQSALVDRRTPERDLPAARLDTAVGAVVAQVVMIAVLVAAAATFGPATAERRLDSVASIAGLWTGLLGGTWGRLLFAVGISGAALVAALVVSLTAAWGLGEVAGYRRSLSHSPRQAPWFYAVYTLAVVAAAAVVLLGGNLVQVSLLVEVGNALLLPVVLVALFVLALRALPARARLGRLHAVVAGIVIAALSLFAAGSAIAGLVGGA